MSHKDSPTQQPRPLLANDWHDCQVRRYGDTDAVECRMEIIRCKWAIPFMGTRLCNYPLAGQHINPER